MILFQSFPAFAEVVKFEALESILRSKNEKFLAAESLALGTKERTGHLARSFLPGVSVKGGTEAARLGPAATEQREFWNLEAKVNLYRGGRDHLENEIRKGEVQVAMIGAKSQFQAELREARKTYWRLVANQKVIEIIKEAIKNNEENIRVAKRRAGAGVTTSADSLQFELENTVLIQQLKKRQIEDDGYRNKLSVLLALDDHKSLSVDSTLPHPPDDTVPKESALNPKPLVVAEVEGLEMIRRLERDKTSRWWIPSLDAFASYGRPSFEVSDTRATLRQDQWISGVQFTFNADQSFEDMANRRAKDQAARAAQLTQAYTSRTASADGHALVHQLNLFHDLLHDAKNDVSKAEKFLSLTKAEYSRGVKNGPDVLSAFSRYFEFKNREIELHLAFYEAKADFMFHNAQVD